MFNLFHYIYTKGYTSITNKHTPNCFEYPITWIN